jgi:hypothetical protein
MVNRQEQWPCVSVYLGDDCSKDDKKEALWKEIQRTEINLENVHDLFNCEHWILK